MSAAAASTRRNFVIERDPAAPLKPSRVPADPLKSSRVPVPPGMSRVPSDSLSNRLSAHSEFDERVSCVCACVCV